MNIYDLDTPALLVDLDRLEQNIARMAEIARSGGKALRPHTKTHKTPEIARLQIRSGANGLTVAKLGEAEVYAAEGFDDIFVANQIVGAPKIDRLLDLSTRCHVSIGVDSAEAAEALSRAAASRSRRIPVRMEIDTGLGRAGVRTLEDVVSLGKLIAGSPGLELAGLFTHEGHVYHVPEYERQAACHAVAVRMMEARDALASEGIRVTDLSAGSTPGAAYLAAEEGVTEIRPGVYVFGDVMQTKVGTSLDDCALTVLATVVSRPDSDTIIIDAGTKALSGDRAAEGSKHGLISDDHAIVFDWANEEHGHLSLAGSELQPRVGQKLRVYPWHACATVNMHEEIYAYRGERLEGTWPISARGKFR